jgi:hypothetical protein
MKIGKRLERNKFLQFSILLQRRGITLKDGELVSVYLIETETQALAGEIVDPQPIRG